MGFKPPEEPDEKELLAIKQRESEKKKRKPVDIKLMKINKLINKDSNQKR